MKNRKRSRKKAGQKLLKKVMILMDHLDRDQLARMIVRLEEMREEWFGKKV